MVKELTGNQLRQSSDDSDGGVITIIQRDRVRPTNIKKILLTRRYHDTNVYYDIGIRVIGGKKLPNGELAAFVSTINRGKAWETLGEIKEGDRVLEWNGVLLTGKTFEEVEQVIAASRGEIEVVVASNPISSMQITSSEIGRSKTIEKQKNRREQKHDETRNHSQKSEAPPVPAHRCADGRASLSSDSCPALKPTVNGKTTSLQPRNHTVSMLQTDTLGYLNVGLAYNRSTSTLMVKVLSAKSLAYRQYCNAIFYPNPFVKIYLLPGRRVSSKRRTKFVPNTSDPVWDQTLEYTVPFHELYSHYLEFTVWDYDKLNDNNALGKVVISLSDPYVLNGTSRWYPLHPTDNDLALRLPSPEFHATVGIANGCSMLHYNPSTAFTIYGTRNSDMHHS
ncbi:unnamed protein product [Onchocerca flexuosa]|uniref:C2 domain-containing protein n=1 Tax=Onchocerca flexuosa TaxID=387005 RepID=A0A183HZC2_9BILA|nr:unnamed protein product [Onchocerca flexuosa]